MNNARNYIKAIDKRNEQDRRQRRDANTGVVVTVNNDTAMVKIGASAKAIPCIITPGVSVSTNDRVSLSRIDGKTHKWQITSLLETTGASTTSTTTNTNVIPPSNIYTFSMVGAIMVTWPIVNVNSVYVIETSPDNSTWTEFTKTTSNNVLIPSQVSLYARVATVNVLTLTASSWVISELTPVTANTLSSQNSSCDPFTDITSEAIDYFASSELTWNDNFYPAEAAFDDGLYEGQPSGTGGTLWASETTSNEYIGIEFQNERTISYYTIKARSDVLEQSPKSWQFEYWDGSNWIAADAQSNISWQSNETKSFFFEDYYPTSTRFRIFVFSNNNGNVISIQEIELFELCETAHFRWGDENERAAIWSNDRNIPGHKWS